MGLTTWADAPEGKIKKSDVTVAKNYLSQDEMKQLNRMVTAYLDFAENMTLRHIPLTMQNWEKRLDLVECMGDQRSEDRAKRRDLFLIERYYSDEYKTTETDKCIFG